MASRAAAALVSVLFSASLLLTHAAPIVDPSRNRNVTEEVTIFVSDRPLQSSTDLNDPPLQSSIEINDRPQSTIDLKEERGRPRKFSKLVNTTAPSLSRKAKGFWIPVALSILSLIIGFFGVLISCFCRPVRDQVIADIEEDENEWEEMSPELIKQWQIMKGIGYGFKGQPSIDDSAPAVPGSVEPPGKKLPETSSAKFGGKSACDKLGKSHSATSTTSPSSKSSKLSAKLPSKSAQVTMSSKDTTPKLAKTPAVKSGKATSNVGSDKKAGPPSLKNAKTGGKSTKGKQESGLAMEKVTLGSKKSQICPAKGKK